MSTDERRPEPFGVCPKCGECSEPFKIGSSWWQCCTDHRTAWVFPNGMMRMGDMLDTADEVCQDMQTGGYTIVNASMNHERDKIQNELYMDAIKAIVGYRGCTPDEAMDLLEPEKRQIPF